MELLIKDKKINKELAININQNNGNQNNGNKNNGNQNNGNQNNGNQNNGNKNSSDDESSKLDLYSINSVEKNLYTDFLTKLEELKVIHINTSVFYEKRNNCIFIPTIVMTAIGSVISFLSASMYFNNDVRIALGLSVGIITILSSLLQTLQKAFKYKTKAEIFRNSAEQYDLLLIQIKFELTRHDEKDFIVNFEKKLLEITSNCKYFPPRHIIDKYENKLKKKNSL